ncbi:MAG: PRC-barrel domain-containing protein [Firmicutes bacterium]|nr:PRC-barrel domain-containing protein [Bacillota bacterium]
MRKSKRFISMPVISLEEGREIGAVRGLVVNPAEKKIAALSIEQKGWFKEQKFIPYAKIRSVGDDAITVDKSAGVERSTGLPDIVKLLKDKTDIVGAKLVTEQGAVLGFVDEFYVDLTTGTIAGLEFAANFINSVIKGRAFLDISHVRTIGKEVIVVTDEGADNIYKLDGGLQETVKYIKESTGQIWENTMQKTKEIGANINKSLEKVKKDVKGRKDQGGHSSDEDVSQVSAGHETCRECRCHEENGKEIIHPRDN